jgi:hypothetical protein
MRQQQVLREQMRQQQVLREQRQVREQEQELLLSYRKQRGQRQQ